MTDTPAEEVIDHASTEPKAQALVILPFMSKQAAEQFAVLVMAQFGAEFQSPIVTSGTAYEYITEEEHGQVFELYADANWEAFVSPENDEHHIIRRVTQRGEPNAASTG